MVGRGKVSPADVHGDVDEGYGKVADAFRVNFTERGEIGAAVAVYRDGVKVVDFWGGYRDRTTRAPWLRDTVVTVYSTTKGIAGLAVAVAVSRGWIDYSARVSDYWPEFAEAGKGGITVRQCCPIRPDCRRSIPRPLSPTSPIPNGCRRCSPPNRPLGHPAPGTAITPCRWAGTSLSSFAASTRPGAHWAASSPTRSPAHWDSMSTSAFRR